MSRSLLKEVAYELYKQDWIDGHSSREMRLKSLQEYYNTFLNETTFSDSYEEYLEEHGFAGMIYSSFAEFVTNEYLDKEYMQHLLGEEIYAYFKEEGEFSEQNESSYMRNIFQR